MFGYQWEKSEIQGSKGPITMECRPAWWFTFYHMGVWAAHWLTRQEVDEAKFLAMTLKAMRFRFYLEGKPTIDFSLADWRRLEEFKRRNPGWESM